MSNRDRCQKSRHSTSSNDHEYVEYNTKSIINMCDNVRLAEYGNKRYSNNKPNAQNMIIIDRAVSQNKIFSDKNDSDKLSNVLKLDRIPYLNPLFVPEKINNSIKQDDAILSEAILEFNNKFNDTIVYKNITDDNKEMPIFDTTFFEKIINKEQPIKQKKQKKFKTVKSCELTDDIIEVSVPIEPLPQLSDEELDLLKTNLHAISNISEFKLYVDNGKIMDDKSYAQSLSRWWYNQSGSEAVKLIEQCIVTGIKLHKINNDVKCLLSICESGLSNFKFIYSNRDDISSKVSELLNLLQENKLI